MKVKVQTLDAAAAGEVELNDAVFGVEPRTDILHRVVTWQLEKRRATARATRERSDVARTGKKVGRQRGDRQGVVEGRSGSVRVDLGGVRHIMKVNIEST